MGFNCFENAAKKHYAQQVSEKIKQNNKYFQNIFDIMD